MAVHHNQSADERRGRINRTPAPDDVSRIRAPSGLGYGQNDGQSNPSSVAPGKAVMSPLAANLKASQDDGEGTLDRVIQGLGGRPDGILDIADEERTVSAEQYPTSSGMRRQQADLATIGRNSLPATLGASADDSAARRAAEIKAGQA